MKIVHATTEFAPWVRVGYLADSVSGLARELARLGHEVSVFLPGYRQVLADSRAARAEPFFRHTFELGDALVNAETLRLPLEDNLTLYLVRRDESFDRSYPYGPPGGEYEDSDARFLIFCKAIADALCRAETPVDVLHCHDWPTALAPLLTRVEERKRGLSAVGRTVFTLHHPAFQGVYPRRTFALTNLPEEFFAADGLEFYGQINFLKGGLVFAEALLAPSPATAQALLEPDYGFGLEGVLARRREDLRGLLTGLDDTEWNPAHDPHLPAPFDAAKPGGKARCREALRQGLGLDPATAAGPLIVVELPIAPVLRLGDPRELLSALEENTVLVLLGQPGFSDMDAWRALVSARPGRVALLENYEWATLHRVLGGADFCLGAARIEPSPHHAQRAQRYGAIPVMARSGGPADVIVDADEQPEAGTGILFAPTLEGWRDGLARAQHLHGRPSVCAAIRARGLAVDSSWQRLAPAYARLYKDLV